MTKNYFRHLLAAIRGKAFAGTPEFEVMLNRSLAYVHMERRLKDAVAERDAVGDRYAALVCECTRHRHATWEITHK